MLYDYLIENYKAYEPIFTSDIDLGIPGNSLRPKLKGLVDAGKLCRYDAGIYYLPGKSKLKGLVPISASTVARCKYVSQRGKVRGYYAGFTFANQMGLSLQVPYVQEIVSNEASAKVREIEIKGQKFLLRKPRTVITEENYRVLQFLDFLVDFDKYMDGSVEDIPARLVQIIKDENITKKVIDAYISLYPTKVYKNLYETGVVYAIA
ncbi:DUF6088 family protein [Eubacterium ruminantium]|uniref:Transcriptional regulator, AbiEi antitoxin, Type IV TA system n=1 Tax=Eubacterium ruminantium TaxID=42322 RepID=A0A1T4QMS3_9FIRM|nr:DUF6088 family protein [Eubacterium ruminantium]SCW69400.1 hypothetical protein SAMN05660484_02555 [Eubacterium ruminantium]SDN42965.1 hypothetical protein SAMN04490370_12410 [Eubacterium ruminantium]SKA05063.1 hypothetical protein SAMN02745110_02453 [Eubacterium ruminantium]